jgi:hypothetical protein
LPVSPANGIAIGAGPERRAPPHAAETKERTMQIKTSVNSGRLVLNRCETTR